MKKVALLYCGIVDDNTIQTCLNSVKTHLLDNTIVFMVLSSSMKEKHEMLIRNAISPDILAHIDWVGHDTDHVQHVKNSVLQTISSCVSGKHKDYLENSDALLEYYRVHKAYEALVKYEYENKTRFDYITRIRPDAIFCGSISYPSEENITKESLEIRLNHIRKKYHKNHEILAMLVYSYFLPQRVESTHPADFLVHSLEDLEKSTILDDYTSLVKNGKYLLTIGKNLMFITKRHHFNMLAYLGLSYGHHFLPGFKQWLDPPEQFQICALLNGYSIFDSITKQELAVIKNYDSSKVNIENGFMFIAS